MRWRLLGRASIALIATAAALGIAVVVRQATKPRGCYGPPIARAPDGTPIPPAGRTGQLLVTHDAAGDASIVDLARGEVTYVELGLTDPHETAVSPDGRWGIVSDFGQQTRRGFQGNRVAVIDMRARRLTRVDSLGASRGLHGVAFVPGRDGVALVTAQTSRQLVMLDVTTGRVLARMDTGADGSHLVAVSADGRFAYTGNEGDGTVSRFDLIAQARVARFQVAPARAEGIAVFPDGDRLWVGSNDPGTIYEVRATDGTMLDSLTGFLYPDRIVMPPSGPRALVMDAGCVHVIDREQRRREGDIVGLAGSFTTSPDGTVGFLLSKDDAVVLVELAARRELARIRLRERPHGAAWGPTPR